jgi:hypothetical protein
LVANLLAYIVDPSVWQQRRLRKLQALGKTECGLRVVAGSQDGLNEKWTWGFVVLLPGSLEFLP